LGVVYAQMFTNPSRGGNDNFTGALIASPSQYSADRLKMAEHRFGFTGTRLGMPQAQKAALRDFLSHGSGEFHHGDCIGADSEAHDIAAECGYCIVLHPPSDPALRAWRVVPDHMMRPKRPYLDRNRDIVRDTDSLIATPAEAEEQQRSGTWSTVRFARKQGKPVVSILPGGTIRQRSV
jgi:hypothetical protein